MNKEWEILIDRYIRHELSEDEKTVFKGLLEAHEDFRKQLVFMQSLAAGMERINEAEVILELTGKGPAKTPTRRNKITYIALSAVAAAILVLVVAGLGPRYSSARLFELSYAPPVYHKEYSRGTNTNLTIRQMEELETAFGLYGQRRYQSASLLFDAVIKAVGASSLSENVLFYNAICKIETGFPNEAFDLLGSLILKENDFQADAQWYLALLYLQREDRDKAIELLKGLLEDEQYKDKAAGLINDIKERKLPLGFLTHNPTGNPSAPASSPHSPN